MEKIRRWGLILLLVATAGILGLFVWEGAKKDRQGLEPVMTVGSKTLRDATETLASSISVPVEDEIALGQRVLRHIRVLPAQAAETLRVRRIGQRLARHCKRKGIRYRFYVVPWSLPNAFALPGGYVLVTEGLLRLADPNFGDSELAWVVAHELMHIERRHALVRLRIWMARQKLKRTILRDAVAIARLTEHLLRLSYSENMELEADKGGLLLMREADFNPHRAPFLIDKLMARRRAFSPRESRHPWVIGVRISRQAIRSYAATHPHWAHRRAMLLQWLGRQKK